MSSSYIAGAQSDDPSMAQSRVTVRDGLGGSGASLCPVTGEMRSPREVGIAINGTTAVDLQSLSSKQSQLNSVRKCWSSEGSHQYLLHHLSHDSILI